MGEREACRNKDWSKRYGTLGDPAESQFEIWAHDNSIIFERFGLNRPAPNMGKWPAFIRYTPDYIVHDRLIEVKGCGRDGLIKIKQENLEALWLWGEYLPVWIFSWNSDSRVSTFWPLNHGFAKWLSDSCDSDRFPDSDKVYWKIPFGATVEVPWADAIDLP